MSTMSRQRAANPSDRRAAVVALAEAAPTWEPRDWWRLEGLAWAGTKRVPLALAQVAPPTTLHAMAPPGRPTLLTVLNGIWIIAAFVGGIVLHIFGLALIAGPLRAATATSSTSDGVASASPRRHSRSSIWCARLPA